MLPCQTKPRPLQVAGAATVTKSMGPIDIFGCIAGTVTIRGDIIGPIGDLEWTADEDNVCGASKL
jgi:hypothetical protein